MPDLTVAEALLGVYLIGVPVLIVGIALWFGRDRKPERGELEVRPCPLGEDRYIVRVRPHRSVGR